MRQEAGYILVEVRCQRLYMYYTYVIYLWLTYYLDDQKSLSLG